MARDNDPGQNKLRDRAEQKLNSMMTAASELYGGDPQKLIHELEVYQIELEIQNEELRNAQAELEKSRAKYSDLYDFAPVSYLTIDERGIIIEANLTAATKFEADRSSLLNAPFTVFVAMDQRGLFRRHLNNIFLTRKRHTCELDLVSKTGARFFALLDSILVPDSSGTVCRTSVIDITERRRAEEQLQIYAAKLERSNKELEEFAFLASHDLREPLRKVQAFGNLLRGRHAGGLDGKGLEYLERMIDATIRMGAMVKGLLDYSRINTKAEPFKMLDLAALIRDTASDLEILTRKTGGTIEIGSLPHIEAEPHQMRRLFQNLIENALKFHGEKRPVIRIHGEQIEGPVSRTSGESRRERICKILVEDNGIGFDEQYMDRIFTLFQRLHGRSQYEGTGMGLAICRKIAERHRGTLTAKSTPGKGSTFIVTLPLKQMRGEVQIKHQD